MAGKKKDSTMWHGVVVGSFAPIIPRQDMKTNLRHWGAPSKTTSSPTQYRVVDATPKGGIGEVEIPTPMLRDMYASAYSLKKYGYSRPVQMSYPPPSGWYDNPEALGLGKLKPPSSFSAYYSPSYHVTPSAGKRVTSSASKNPSASKKVTSSTSRKKKRSDADLLKSSVLSLEKAVRGLSGAHVKGIKKSITQMKAMLGGSKLTKTQQKVLGRKLKSIATRISKIKRGKVKNSGKNMQKPK